MIGIDIIRISRVEAAAKRGSFLRCAFSDSERRYYYDSGEKAQCLAGMYAAKEAVIKAAGIRISQIKLNEIEVLHENSGKPYINFLGSSKRLFLQYSVHISISHDGDYAIAAAILNKNLEQSGDSESVNVPNIALMGIDPALIETLCAKIDGITEHFAIPDELLNIGKNIALPLREVNSHKGNYGRIRIIASSAEMPGAGLMTMEAALRSGGGLVTLCVPYSLALAYQSKVKEGTLQFLPEKNGKLVFEKSAFQMVMGGADCIVIGMGLGQNDGIAQILEYILGSYEGTLIIDADGLNVISKNPQLIKTHKCKLILTPHVGEFERLVKAYGLIGKEDLILSENSPKAILQRSIIVKELAKKLNAYIICKDYISTVSDGEVIYFNDSGCPAMAKGGSGDVLSGIIAAVSVRLSPLDALLFASYHFGKAGEAAAGHKGEESVLASDIIDSISF